jgi:hypothetical protein
VRPASEGYNDNFPERFHAFAESENPDIAQSPLFQADGLNLSMPACAKRLL